MVVTDSSGTRIVPDTARAPHVEVKYLTTLAKCSAPAHDAADVDERFASFIVRKEDTESTVCIHCIARVLVDLLHDDAYRFVMAGAKKVE